MARYCQWVLMHLNAFILSAQWGEIPGSSWFSPRVSNKHHLHHIHPFSICHLWKRVLITDKPLQVRFSLNYHIVPHCDCVFHAMITGFFFQPERNRGASLMFSIVLSQYYSFSHGKPKHLKVESSAVENCNLYKKRKANATQTNRRSLCAIESVSS